MDLFAALHKLAELDTTGISTIIYTVFVFIIVIGVLVFVHEWGHFTAARSVGVKVEQFSIGFGKEIWARTDKHGTRWKISLIPLGGYVQMMGQEDGKAITASDDPNSFASKPKWARAWIIFAGPFVNFLFAIVVLAGLFMFGEEKLYAQVGEVLPNTPAYEAQMQPNDKVLEIEGTPIAEWRDMVNVISERPNQPTQMSILRGEQRLNLVITPAAEEVPNLFGEPETVGRIGIQSAGETFKVYHNPIAAVGLGVKRTYELTGTMLVSIGKLLTGQVSAKHIAGPLGIADLAEESAQHGTAALLMFMVVISINLGIVNLLPIPVLDGGHLLFIGFETLFGKPPSEAIQMWGTRLGLALVLALVLFSTSNDLQRLGVFKFIGLENTPIEAPLGD